MEATKLPPGPWKFVADFRCANGELTSGVVSEKTGCAVAWPHGRNELEEIAIGRAISAVPELLTVCEFVMQHGFTRKWDGDERAFNMLSAAMAKVTGSPAKTTPATATAEEKMS